MSGRDDEKGTRASEGRGAEAGTTRRGFLKLLGASAGVAAVGAPWIWVPKRSFAATSEAHGAAKHVIVLYADGGLRSPAIFNADLALQWNPHVDGEGAPTQSTVSGTEWKLGAVADRSSYALPSWGEGERLKPLSEVADQVAVLGTVDHEPDAKLSDANHQSAKLRMTTGFLDGQTGFLAQIYKHHPMYAGEGRLTLFPPAVIGGSARQYGLANGEDGKFRPLFFNGPEDFQRGGIRSFHIEQPGWAKGFAQRQDERFAGKLSVADQARVGLYTDSKQNMDRFRDILALPQLNLLGDGEVEASLGSNVQLREAFGLGAWGPKVALAVRLLQFGSPMVVVGVSGYDTHSNEMVDFPPLARDLTRQLAALCQVLPRLPHPAGGTYWDHTVVTVLSEFSRDNTERLTGYNSAQGSDHRGENGSRYQSLPFLGGPVAGGRFRGKTDRSTMMAQDEVYASQGVLASLSDLVGVDPGLFLQERPVTDMLKL